MLTTQDCFRRYQRALKILPDLLHDHTRWAGIVLCSSVTLEWIGTQVNVDGETDYVFLSRLRMDYDEVVLRQFVAPFVTVSLKGEFIRYIGQGDKRPELDECEEELFWPRSPYCLTSGPHWVGMKPLDAEGVLSLTVFGRRERPAMPRYSGDFHIDSLPGSSVREILDEVAQELPGLKF